MMNGLDERDGLAPTAEDLDGGIAHCERALSLDSGFSAARYFLGPMLLAAGRANDAITALEAASDATQGSPEVAAALATVYAGTGNRTTAEDLLSTLLATGATRYVSEALTSMVRGALGDLDGAIADMERAVEVIWLDVRPVYAPLRADARFTGLLARRAAARRIEAPTSVA